MDSLSLSFCLCTHPSIPHMINTHSDTQQVQWRRTYLATQPVSLTLMCGLAARQYGLWLVLLLVLIWSDTQVNMGSGTAGTIQKNGGDRWKWGKEVREGKKSPGEKELEDTLVPEEQFFFFSRSHIKHGCWLWLSLRDLKTHLKCDLMKTETFPSP